MKTKFIEATDSTEFNYGKFAVCRWEPEEWRRPSAIIPGNYNLLGHIGNSSDNIWVIDLQTGEGARFVPGGSASVDLHNHRVWVCPMFEPFLAWLYKQNLDDLDQLPAQVNLGNVPTALQGYRRPGPSKKSKIKV